jgi:pimeloyl-ACP methyl ester carboxylesterase
METVTSRDGTTIAFDRYGDGPPVILIGGAFQYRALDPRAAELAAQLGEQFTVFHYDRRGLGDSSDTAPYAVERELEDLEALISEAGGSTSLYGSSSRGNLALAAAKHGREAPMWPGMEAAAHTLSYNGRIVDGFGLNRDELAFVETPTLVMDGGQTPWMSGGAEALAATLPNATHRRLDGQGHDVASGVLAPELIAFFG